MVEVFQSFCWDHRERLTPVRASSPEGLLALHELGFEPTCVYIDGDHRYEGVLRDLFTAELLFPGALLAGDDWSFTSKANKYRGMAFPVRAAVTDFCAFRGFGVRAESNTWLVDQSEDRTPVRLRRETPAVSAGGPQVTAPGPDRIASALAEVSGRLDRVEAAVRRADANRVVPTLRRLRDRITRAS